MAEEEKSKTSKKFGARYGTRLRKRVSEVERKKTKECPKCGKRKLNRVASGIWKCGSCGVKFAGKAYSPE